MKIYGIFGDPIGHSLSPVMQGAAFEAMGVDACYHAFRVTVDHLGVALRGAEAMGFCGLNLTIPLKERALDYVVPDRTASEMGAVNTVRFAAEMEGYNTDGLGAARALEAHGIRVRGERVLIVGAGGAARAIALQLSREGAAVTVANRSPERAGELAGIVGGEGHGLDQLRSLVSRADVVINATSVGMRDGDPRLMDGTWIREDQAVFDVVYNRETELIKDARLAGAMAVDGVMMLVYQGAEAIRIWTGMEPPVKVMEGALRWALAGGRRSGGQRSGRRPV